MSDQQTPAGWYPDGDGGQRWWDGAAWTEHVAPGGPERPVPPAPAVPPSQEVTQVPGAPSPFAQPAQQPVAQPYPPQGGSPGWPPAPPSGGSGGGRRGLFLALGGVGVLVVALVVVLVVVLAGRDGGSGSDGGDDDADASSPEGVVQAYFDTAKEGSCDVVEYFSNEGLGVSEDTDREEAVGDARDRCVDADAFEEDDGAGCELDLADTQEDGDTATIDFEITGCDDPDDEDDGTASLVKEDGEWRITTFG